MAASVPAVRNGSGSGSGSAAVADADEDNSCAAMAVLGVGGSSKRTPPDRSILHVTDLPIKKRIQFINQQAAEIQTETKTIQLINQETAETRTGTETPPVCDICNRTFASSRSVAIHKGHHLRRGRARMQEQGAVENPNSRMNEQRQAIARRRRRLRQSNGPGAVHDCRRCWRSFISGQALGAHKRHCTWPPVEQEIVNNFDLNEVPPPEEEDSLVFPWHYGSS